MPHGHYLSYAVDAEKFAITNKNFSPLALKIVKRLHEHGFDAFIVGGAIRDLLLGKTPKDFDIATNARPEQIKSIFTKQCRIIGKRFRLAHIVYGREIFEVATFRGDHSSAAQRGLSGNIAEQNEHGIIMRDNVYGDIFDDAKRRDFTINSLYYDVRQGKIIDFFNAIDDIFAHRLCVIGDPKVRFREDPVRMLRAVRFMAKLQVFLEPSHHQAIEELKMMLGDMPKARLFDESVKLLQSGNGLESFALLKKFDLFKILFPSVARSLTKRADSPCDKMITIALQSTDERIADNLPINPAFLFAAILWYPMKEMMEQYKNEMVIANQDALMMAANDIFHEVNQGVLLTKYHASVIRDIWLLQFAMMKRNLRSAMKTLARPKFRAGFDLLLMRARIEGGELIESASWWHEFQLGSPYQRNQQLKSLNTQKTKSSSQKRSKQRLKNKEDRDE